MKKKTKGLIYTIIMVILYAFLKLHVLQTPSEDDDQLPDEILKHILLADSSSDPTY